MLLAIDIGNSSIKFGLFDSKNLISRFAIPTSAEQTPDEIHRVVESELDYPITAVIVSSVVPEIDAAVREFSLKYLGVKAVFVTNEFDSPGENTTAMERVFVGEVDTLFHTRDSACNAFDFGFPTINYEPVASLGVDRLIVAFAAAQKYGIPCIVCDFGTATTIDIANTKGEYFGGVITPGMNTLAEALYQKTAKLPRVTIEKPQNVIGSSTVTCMQSGIFYGYLGLVEGILIRMAAESGESPKIVATGGFASLIAENCGLIDVIDENLMLDGLRMLHERRRALI